MKLIIPILIVLPLLCHGQGNLVPNGSFEDIVSCPTGTSQIQLAEPWLNGEGGIELYHSCNQGNPAGNPHVGVPANTTGQQSAHTGDAYAGIYTYGGQYETNGREYLQVPLTQPLESGGYVVSFWASLADEFDYAVGSLGAHFSDTLITRESFNSLPGVEPSVQSPVGQVFSNKEIWYLITDTFSSRYGGEQYLTIGNFKSTQESDTLFVPTNTEPRLKSYYYIDDVSVIALGDTVSGIGETERLQFNIYPNPAIETVNIEGKERFTHVQLLDIRGKEVMAKAANGSTYSLNLSGVPDGIYLLRVTDDEGRSATQRLVKLAEP